VSLARNPGDCDEPLRHPTDAQSRHAPLAECDSQRASFVCTYTIATARTDEPAYSERKLKVSKTRVVESTRPATDDLSQEPVTVTTTTTTTTTDPTSHKAVDASRDKHLHAGLTHVLGYITLSTSIPVLAAATRSSSRGHYRPPMPLGPVLGFTLPIRAFLHLPKKHSLGAQLIITARPPRSVSLPLGPRPCSSVPVILLH